ncbi:ABC transporter permease, partial [Dactylosporangium fulvum]|uniref:ABC transporter permease n=1 Tax=Dactylosporangium fulvum TaxID=53359 RepID=UPI0031CDC1DF
GRARWIVGGLAVAAGVALAIGTATTGDAEDGAAFALYSAMALVTGAAVLAPAAVPPVVRLCRGGAIAQLIRESTLTAPRRTASTAAPVLLTVAFAVLVSGMVRTTTDAYAAGRAADVDTRWALVPDRTPGLSDAVFAGLPADAPLPTTVYTDDGVLTAVGVAGGAAQAGEVTVSASTNRRVGETMTVVFADGEAVPLLVAAVAPTGDLRGDLVLSRDVVRAHDPSALAPAVHLREPFEPPAGSGARVVDVATWAAEADSAEDRLVWLATLMLIGVSAGYGAIAVANTLLMAGAGRAPDVRVVRLAGATRRQVLAFVVGESAFVVLIGAVLGGVVAFAALLSIRAGLSEQVGAPVDLVVPWSVIGVVVGLCLLLATLAAAATARREPAVQC